MLISPQVEQELKLIPGKPNRCPGCGRKDIRQSVFGGLRDNFMKMCGFMPYRCRACETRFYRKMRLPEEVEEQPQPPSPA